MPDYIIKGPEELLIDDLIPTVGDSLVVESIRKIDPTHFHGPEGYSHIPIGYRVTFTDGSFTVYPAGSAIRVET
jgi:hypothetical protein